MAIIRMSIFFENGWKKRGLLHVCDFHTCNNPFVFFSGYQGGGGVDPGQEFLVQGIQPFGIAAEQFEFLD